MRHGCSHAHACRGGYRRQQALQRTTLTSREHAVASLVVAGHTSKQIARLLRISDLTVRKHRENILRKLGLRSTAQLAACMPRHADVGTAHA